MDEANQYRINKLKSLKTGDTVYLVPYDSRINPFSTRIISLGNKWMKLDYMHRSENKFDVMNNYRHTPDLGSASYELHASEEDYKEYLRINSAYGSLVNTIVNGLIKDSNIETLHKVIKRWHKLISRQP